MHSCGMYEHSGEFSYYYGVPAKSSISGGLMIVIPGVGGICTFAPKLDKMNNSIKGNLKIYN